MSKSYQAKRIVLNGIGILLLAVGIILFIGGYNDSRLHGDSLESSQSEVGGVLIAITGIILLWRGSKSRDNKVS
jgi:uncharacterized membrane protein YgdD (TMEM256/DUF423 family)